ncbi:MAG: hypothetical protein DRO13_06285 [Thermoprotei archaeon]|nr:MAG: hypothetical protein DRO13_06285 [Thermoprotei archaeon]
MLSLPYRVVVGGESIVVREPSSPRDYRELMDVQIRIWGMPDYSEAVTYHALIAAHRNGGVVLGAFRESDAAVGLVYSFPGYERGSIYLYSHLTGVVPEHRYRGLGYVLKRAQRALALEKGYSLVKWTFDPLRSSNAYFNLAKLGVVVRKFYPDYYGELADEINRGMPTDRVIAEWWIDSPRVSGIVEKGARATVDPEKLAELNPLNAVSVQYDGQLPIITEYRLEHSSEVVVVEIPGDIEPIRRNKPELLLEWRKALRAIFEYYLNKLGYVVVGYTILHEEGRKRGLYVLWKRSLEEVLEGNYLWK